MKKISSVLIAGAMALGTTTGAFAKETADQAAERYDACNDKKYVSARYLESGQLEITCPAGSFSGNPMSQTGLTSGAAAAAGIIVLALLVGNDGSSSTTTTTTSP